MVPDTQSFSSETTYLIKNIALIPFFAYKKRKQEK